MNEDFMTIKEVMERLGIARSTVYKYVSQGRLSVYHKGIGKASYFKRDEVEKLLEFTLVDSPKENRQFLMTASNAILAV